MTEILVDYKIDSERFKLFALKVAYEVVFKNLGEHIDKNEEIFIKIQNILMQAIGGEFNKKIPELNVVGPLFNEFSCLVWLSDLLQKHIVYTVITKAYCIYSYYKKWASYSKYMSIWSKGIGILYNCARTL